jgi:hypothetical protein
MADFNAITGWSTTKIYGANGRRPAGRAAKGRAGQRTPTSFHPAILATPGLCFFVTNGLWPSGGSTRLADVVTRCSGRRTRIFNGENLWMGWCGRKLRPPRANHRRRKYGLHLGQLQHHRHQLDRHCLFEIRAPVTTTSARCRRQSLTFFPLSKTLRWRKRARHFSKRSLPIDHPRLGKRPQSELRLSPAITCQHCQETPMREIALRASPVCAAVCITSRASSRIGRPVGTSSVH